MEKDLRKQKHSLNANNECHSDNEWDYSSNIDEDYLISEAPPHSKINSLTCKPKLGLQMILCYTKGRKLSHDTNKILPSIINNYNNLKLIGKNPRRIFENYSNSQPNLIIEETKAAIQPNIFKAHQDSDPVSDKLISNSYKATPRFIKDLNLILNPFEAKSPEHKYSEVDPEVEGEHEHEDEEEPENYTGFKYAIVKNLKDTENYYRFIQNNQIFLNKVQKDREWFLSGKSFRLLKSLQSKINKHICFRFEDLIDNADDNK